MAETSGPVAFIPARGGSRRIPRKNLRPILGVPALRRVLDVVTAAQTFDRVVVSSDDEEILALAAQVPGVETLRRPSALADDHTTFTEVVRDFATTCAPEVSAVAAFVATAVSLQNDDIHRVLAVARSGRWEFVFTAGALDVPVERTLTQDSEGGCRMHDPRHFSTRSQDLPRSYRDAGMIYVGAPDAWRSGAAIFTERSTFIEIPRWRVHDLDTEEDWQYAERVLGAHGMTKDRGLD